MKRCNLLFIGFLMTFTPLLHAQETDRDYRLRYITVDSLVQILESQTPYRFYYSDHQTDTLLISISTQGGNTLSVLDAELRKYGFSLSRARGNQLYIIKGTAPQTSLPVDFYQARQDLDIASQGYAAQQDLQAAATAADSENRLYTLGDPQQADLPGEVRLTGYLRDRLTGQPVPGISIFSEDKKSYGQSDTYGFYSMTLPRGYTTVMIQGFGYKESHRDLRIFSDSALDINIEEEVYALQGIVISAEKMENVRNVQMGVEKVRADRIRHVPMAFGEADVIKVVLTLPGVKSVGEVSGGFNVRGGAADQNLILFNEGTVYNPSHLFGLFSLFNNDIVSNIELYKSSIPSRYGGRISSVLEVNSREGNKNKFTGSAGIGILTSKVNVEGPIVKEKTSFILAARTTYSDWIFGLIPENSGYSDGTANFYDLNAGISHKFNDKNFLYVNGYYSRDHFSFDNLSSYKYNNANASVKFRSVLSDRAQLVVSGAYDQYNYKNRDTSYATAAYQMSYKLQQVTLKADYTLRLQQTHKLSIGANAYYYRINPGNYEPFDNKSLVTEKYVDREQAIDAALYVDDTWDITPDFSVEAGLRYNFYSALGPKTYNLYDPAMPPSLETLTGSKKVEPGKMVKPYSGPELRASLRYSITPTLSLKAGFNSMRQNIHMLSNTAVISPTDIWKLSDANIRPQSGWQAAAGVYKNFLNNTLECSIEGYYKQMNHYLDYAASAQLLMNPHVETDVIDTKGKAYGVELMLKRTLGRLNGWLSYTYSRTQLRQNDSGTGLLVNNGNWYPAAYDKPHDVKLVGNFMFTHRFSLSANVDYATGRPITLPVGTYYYQGGWRLYYTDRNAGRIPDYFRLDIAFNIEPSHKLTLLTHSSVTIGIYNVTGRKNPYSVFYKTEDGHIKSYMLSVLGSPIPYITYNIKF